MDEELGTGSGDRLRLSRTTERGRATVAAIGEIDFVASPHLGDALHAAVTDGVHRLDVDLSQVTFCDCSGLNVLLAARCRCGEAGVAFGVSGPVSPAVLRLFRATETLADLPVRCAA
ncbi:STAS domain-containing protein [Streptomyces sp. NPDC048479]|uniref:STAS domain-containing protein n=1 Tax=Streptomyces sp. NPDC048479 TaxID=3154725 RepID=UPI003441E31F